MPFVNLSGLPAEAILHSGPNHSRPRVSESCLPINRTIHPLSPHPPHLRLLQRGQDHVPAFPRFFLAAGPQAGDQALADEFPATIDRDAELPVTAGLAAQVVVLDS